MKWRTYPSTVQLKETLLWSNEKYKFRIVEKFWVFEEKRNSSYLSGEIIEFLKSLTVERCVVNKSYEMVLILSVFL